MRTAIIRLQPYGDTFAAEKTRTLKNNHFKIHFRIQKIPLPDSKNSTSGFNLGAEMSTFGSLNANNTLEGFYQAHSLFCNLSWR